MNGNAWPEEVLEQYRHRKQQSERSLAQVTDTELFETVGDIPLPIAAQMKHLGSNHRSRWRDFLTSDGEKSDRDRDGEFVVDGETRESIQRIWYEGWRINFETLEALGAEDLEKTVTIRGEPLTVAQAIQRNLTHLAYHTGQIVSLARHFAAERWQTLSIPLGGSEEYNQAMRAKWGDWNDES